MTQDLLQVNELFVSLLTLTLTLFEYMNMLSEKRAKSKTTVEKNLYKLLANSTYGKFVETGVK